MDTLQTPISPSKNSFLRVPGSAPPSPSRTFSLDDPAKLAPELDKRYLKSEDWVLAQGASSDVYPGRWECPDDPRYPNGVDVVIKVFRLSGTVTDTNFKEKLDRCGKHLGREVVVWQKINHPRITPFIGYSRSWKDDLAPCIVTPKRAANLGDYLDHHPEANRLGLMFQILEGLVYLHGFQPAPIVHFDIKPGNVLITEEGTAELTDFGCAKALDGIATGYTTAATPGGSSGFMAPEIFIDGLEFDELTPAADVYSVASLALLMFSGQPAWYEMRNKSYVMALASGAKPSREAHPMDGEPDALDKFWELLYACWDLEPEERPSAQQFLDTLYEIELLGGVRPPRPSSTAGS